MDDRKIRCLLTVLKTGSINSAAESLNATQSGLTQTMNTIESELGFKILKRTNRGVVLTEEGERILPAIRTLDLDFKSLEMKAEEIRKDRRSTIRIGTYSSIANSWLPEMLSRYEQVCPDISFEIMIGTDEIMEWLASEKVDMLLADESAAEGFKWYPIMQDDFFVAAPVSFAISSLDAVGEDDLLDYPMIIGTQNTNKEFREIPERMRGKVIRVGSDDDTTIIRMVSKGLGVSIMAGLSLQQMIPEDVRIIRFRPRTCRVIGAVLPLKAVWAARLFTKFLIDQANSSTE
ncbi:MAG: LysR family transcriptional regulator [Lachnospiraceae bacterium]|nr:LysR family transcriptional regulator [Lachnospiraceae bacterium]